MVTLNIKTHSYQLPFILKLVQNTVMRFYTPESASVLAEIILWINTQFSAYTDTSQWLYMHTF